MQDINAFIANAQLADQEYLGDGLYAAHDGYSVFLMAPREDGIHYVALEPPVFKALLEWKDRTGLPKCS